MRKISSNNNKLMLWDFFLPVNYKSVKYSRKIQAQNPEVHHHPHNYFFIELIVHQSKIKRQIA